MTIECVIIEIHFRVEGKHFAFLRNDERIDLGKGGIGGFVCLIQRYQELHSVLECVAFQAKAEGELPRLEILKPDPGVNGRLENLFRSLRRYFFDFDASFCRNHDDIA